MEGGEFQLMMKSPLFGRRTCRSVASFHVCCDFVHLQEPRPFDVHLCPQHFLVESRLCFCKNTAMLAATASYLPVTRLSRLRVCKASTLKPACGCNSVLGEVVSRVAIKCRERDTQPSLPTYLSSPYERSSFIHFLETFSQTKIRPHGQISTQR
jgi:hypothetical protein